MRRFRLPYVRPPFLLALGLLLASGCQSGTGPVARWRMANDTLMKNPGKSEMADDRGLMARWLSPGGATKGGGTKAPQSTLVDGSDGWSPGNGKSEDPETETEFKAAEQLYQKGKLPEAEEAFAKIAKNRKETSAGERAQFYLAEVQFERKRYVKANDSYTTLVTVYPTTKYLEKSVAREYAIGDMWLSYDEGTGKAEERLPETARLDWRMPIVDVGGSALAVMEHVRQHDPTGPLADDAVMRMADHHYKLNDFETAAEYYDQLIANDPKSPFLQKAQLASIEAKMLAYLGPEYDGDGLEKAKSTIRATQAAFPERQASTSDELYHKLDIIAEQKAERAFTTATYYKSAGAVDAAEYYYKMVPARWPKSPYAEKAKTQIALLAKAPRKKILPSRIMTQPGTGDPFSGGAFSGASAMNGGMGGAGGGMGSMGGMGGPG